MVMLVVTAMAKVLPLGRLSVFKKMVSLNLLSGCINF